MLTKMISGLIISSICFSEFCPVSRIRMSSLGNFKNRVNTNRKRKKMWSQTCFKESVRLGRHSKKPQRTKPVYLNTSEVTCRVRQALQDASLTSRWQVFVQWVIWLKRTPATCACSVLRLTQHGSLPPASPRNPLSASMPFLPDSRSRHLHEVKGGDAQALGHSSKPFPSSRGELEPGDFRMPPQSLLYGDPRQRGHWESTHRQ